MEVNTAVVVLVVILLIVLGIFVVSQMNGDGVTTGRSVSNLPSYPSQYSGGGCSR